MLMSVDYGNGARGAGLRGVASWRGAAGVAGARRVCVAWRAWRALVGVAGARLRGWRGVAGGAWRAERAGGPRARGKGGHL